MKLPTQRALDDALRLAHRYNSTRELRRVGGEPAEFRRGYYHGIDTATRDLLRTGLRLDTNPLTYPHETFTYTHFSTRYHITPRATYYLMHTVLKYARN